MKHHATPEQLYVAQQIPKLEAYIDKVIDRQLAAPEPKWGGIIALIELKDSQVKEVEHVS